MAAEDPSHYWPGLLDRQRGQALVGVMVVMVILFALAGAVAIGASTLLTSRPSAGATTDDFRLRSAVNDSVAQVAGSTHACSGAPPPSPLPTPTPSPIPTSLALALPPPDGSSRALCVRMDGVTSGAVSRLPVPTSGTCQTLAVPGGKGPIREALVFDLYVSGSGWAVLDGNPACPPTAPSRGSPCGSRYSQNGAPPVGGAGWTQVALTCDIPDGQIPQLHLMGPMPRQVFAGVQDPAASAQGSVYLLAVQTPVASSPMEEALLFVSGDGSTNRLLYEAPLLP